MMKHKITAPGLSAGIVQRKRLFRLLENGRGKGVVWISGPGGSGKTTLVSSYLEERKLPAIWYHVDQGDADPATFFYYMGLAFKESVSLDHEPLPLLTPEYLAGIKTFARRYFHQLFTQLPSPYVIVLDNYQDVSPFSPLHELLMEGLASIPDGITVIALSRNEPPPVITVHASAEGFQFLGWNELRFSFDEAQQFARTQTENPLETEALTRLYIKTDGWIAGLLLILESLKGSSLDYQSLEGLPLDKVFGYFADKIFDQSDAELQGFLLKTAFAPGITAQMAEQLTDIASSEQILSRLCRNRFFTGKGSPADSVYQYHPLFREFLLARAEKTFPADELRAIRRKAASLLEGAGRTEDAAELLMKAADWEGLTTLLLNAAPIFASEGRSETLRSWLQTIPEDMVARVPGLLYWQGVCFLLHSPSQSRICFRKAFDLYFLANDSIGMALSWSGGSIVSLYDGEFTPLDEWLSLLEGMNLDHFVFPVQQLEDQVVMSVFNAMAFRQPQHPDIGKWRVRAVPLVGGSSDLDFRLQSGVHLLVHDLWNGNFGRATFMLEQIQGMARSRKITPMTDITIRNAQVVHAFFTGAWALGVTMAVDALRLADETGVHVWDGQLLGMGASCALSAGDIGTADNLLNHMQSGLEFFGKRMDVGMYHGLRGFQQTLRHDFPAASRHHEVALECFHGIGFVAMETVALNFMADSLREMGETAQAGTYLSRAYDIAFGMQSGFLEFFCLCNSFQLALDAADEQQAVSLLRKAMELGSAGGYVGSWLWHTASLSLLRLCVKALENEIEVDYVRGLVRRWSLVPETPPLHIDSWPWPLKIRTLGNFELKLDDLPLVVSGKAKKPLELLKALIAFGGKNVAQEQLSDALWPDADGDLAQSSFNTTLHRLRKLLGNEKTLQLQAGKLSLDPRYCWVDTWAFQRQCGECEDALKAKGQQKDKGQLPLYLEKGVGLYKGHFLTEDKDQAWTISMREHTRSKFLHLIKKAGGYYEGLKQWEQAATLYKKGLEVDAHAEEFEQRLMVCTRQQ
jgi:LuxR family maltose regulon positive regulatory protein